MDTDIQYLKMTPPAEESFGFYRLAKAKMRVEYTNIPAPHRVRPTKKPKNKKKSMLSIEET